MKSPDQRPISEMGLPLSETKADIIQEIPMPEEMIEQYESMGMVEQAEDYEKVIELAKAFDKEGGRTLLVGGSVRDLMMGKTPKDFDIEVRGLEPDVIERIARNHGQVEDVGESFSVLKLQLGPGRDIDIALPRTDSKTGRGHKGFTVKPDPYMSTEEAARRRDFTMNAIAADPLTGEILDPFNGRQDIRDRIIRVTDAKLFRDDPLRVMRALQFMARFNMELEQESAKVIRSMLPEMNEVSEKRYLDEWRKMLVQGEKPSLGLAAGMTLGVFREVNPELVALDKLPQRADKHPEGDAWIHTLMVVDESAKIIRREGLSDRDAFIIMLTGVAHDLGKKDTPLTKPDGELKSIMGHAEKGGEPAIRFLDRIGVNKDDQKIIRKLVENHMVPTYFYAQEKKLGNRISDGEIRKLAKKLHPATILQLVMVGEADKMGRGPFEDPKIPEQLLLPKMEYPQGKWLLERARKLGVEASKPAPVAQGRDWLSIGYTPGKHIGELNRLAESLRDDKGFTREKIFQEVYGKSAEEAVMILTKLSQE
ncbi:CCA tRNA nucleotidyltransferase [Patescibacteria group bacterium]